jgi:hypothetical protein
MAIHNETMTIDKVGGMELQGHKGDKRTERWVTENYTLRLKNHYPRRPPRCKFRL